MRKFYTLFFAFLCLGFHSFAQSTDKPIKNIIFMVPDGTSIDIIALTRWYNGGKPLNIEPYICGMVRTISSDSTIADSAPASTAFAIGGKSKSGYIGVNSKKEPIINIMEIARLQGKATGLVVTCEHQNATPADFTAHCENRRDYSTISEQQLYSNINLVFSGGGKNFINATEVNKNTCLFTLRTPENDLQKKLSEKYRFISTMSEFNKIDNSFENIWASFNSKFGSIPNDIDRDSNYYPSLAQMTDKAIQKLSNKKEGFFLLVEGSKVDWAAHANDPVGIVSEFTAFDKAVGIAIDFAKKDGNTVVVICPDHGNGGISIGNDSSSFFSKKYYYDKSQLYRMASDSIKKAKHSAEWIGNYFAEIQNSEDITSARIQQIIKEYYGINLTEKENAELLKIFKTKSCNNNNEIEYIIGRMFSARSFIGWTTHGHTGEDVFLAVYHPENKMLTGIVENTDINKYFCKLFNINNKEELSKNYFSPYTKVFDSKDFDTNIINNELIIKSKTKNLSYRFIANRNYFYKIDNYKENIINSPTLIIKSENIFYIPRKIID
ncbi:MAG: alkaline phosphatase [Bacteroidota bacterium]